jgi:hypothetical protein
MAKPQYFPFFFELFLNGTKSFTAEEVGGYMLLLIEQFDRGFIPVNEEELMLISRIKYRKSLQKVLGKFTKTHQQVHGKSENHILECYINVKMTEVRELIRSKRLKNSKSGKDGAIARWGNHSETIANAIASPSENHGDSNGNLNINRIELNRIKEIAITSETWIEAMCMQMNVTKDQILSHMDMFIIHIKSQGETHKTIKDFQSHFSNWSRINPPKGKPGAVPVISEVLSKYGPRGPKKS